MKKEINLEKYSVRLADKTDSPRILVLINLVQPEIPWTHEHLTWQFFEPSLEKPKLYVVFEKESLIALYAAVNKNILFEGKVKKGLMIQDVMTHPEHRGQGLLNYLSSLCISSIKKNDYYAYTFPNKISEGSFRRNGWKEMSVVPLREVSTADTLPAGNFKLTINEVDSFKENVIEIWRKSNLSIGVERNQEFLNWRYSKPATIYHKFLIENEKGFLVIKLFENEVEKKLHILDLVVEKKHISILRPILDFIRDFSILHGAEKITCWLSEKHPYSKEFSEFGLKLAAQNDRYIFVMAPDKDLEAFSDLENWNLTEGDSDVY